MLRALAIETSGRQGSVALGEDGVVVAEGAFEHGLQHAAGLLPMIDALVRQRDWRPVDIDHIYVSIGPGSFTGLRISVTLAKTLAFATGARVVAVPSARVLVENLPADACEAVTVLDAKRGQVFAARFKRKAAGAPWDTVEPARLDTLAAVLDRAARPVSVTGEGIPFHRGPLQSPGVVIADESSWRARASVLLMLGHAMASRGEFIDASALTPLYIRLPEAEEKRLLAEAAASVAPVVP